MLKIKVDGRQLDRAVTACACQVEMLAGMAFRGGTEDDLTLNHTAADGLAGLLGAIGLALHEVSAEISDQRSRAIREAVEAARSAASPGPAQEAPRLTEPGLPKPQTPKARRQAA